MLTGATTKTIAVNGVACETAARTVAELLAERELAGKPVATAVNGDFVPAGRRGEIALQPGDRIEIVSPRQGG